MPLEGIVISEPEVSPIQPTGTTQEPSLGFLVDWFELDGVNKLSIEKNDQVRYIHDFVINEVGNDPMQVFQYLREASYKLGAPKLGMTKLQHIYQYIKLQKQQKLLNLKTEELING